MEPTFFQWEIFKEEHQLPELPLSQIIFEDSFLIHLEERNVWFSRQLSADLLHQEEKPRVTLDEMGRLLTENSRMIFFEDLTRLSNKKREKTISRLCFLSEGKEMEGMVTLVKIPDRPYVLGIIYLHYDMVSDYEQHLTEVVEKLEEAQGINQLILEGSTDYIYQLDLVNNICTFSPKAIDVLPLETPTFENAMDRILSFIIPEDRNVFLESFTPFLTGKSVFHKSEYRVLTKQGEIMWISCNGKGKHDKDGRPVMIAGSLMDITERKMSEERINRLLNYDNLTGLKNRYCYEQEVTEYMKQENAKGSIVCIDIRNFKKFNEIFGHHYGNKILKTFADILTKYIPDNRGIYRLEGDEFLVHLKESTEEDIRTRLTPLQMGISKARLVGGHNIYFDITMGIAMYPAHGTTAEELLKNADTMLFEMSANSKEKMMFYFGEQDNNLPRRYMLENELRKDIENQFSHFRVVYQPIVKLSPEGESWYSMEALLRYFNPSLPDLTQGEMIETLEHSDLIIQVGRWVLKQALRECRYWRETGADFSVHVNFSAQQLSDANIFNYIKELLADNQVPPQSLVCELTETSLINNFDTAVNLCRDLMDLGVGIALDDFGTGYCSFNYLRTLPINQIKIDKEYVQNLGENNYNQIIISCLHNLSQSMGMELCVEGVETKETLELLSSMGIELIQGFYFERPMEAETIRKEIVQRL